MPLEARNTDNTAYSHDPFTLRSSLTHDHTIRFFSLSFSLICFPFVSLSLSLSFLLNRPVYTFFTLSTLHSSGGRLFVSTYGAPLILLCDSQTKRELVTKNYEQSRCPRCLDCVVVLYDCFFLFFFFSSITRHTRARTSSYPPTPRRPLVTISLNLDTYDSLMLPCLSFPSTHPRTHLAQSHTLFLSLSFFPFLSRDFHSFRQRARRFPLRRSHTRAPFLPLSIMTHTALKKAAHPSLTASEKDSPREQFADPSARLAHDKRIRENPCTGICKYMCVCVWVPAAAVLRIQA